ncbi:MAG TPA: C_GCAxxG_C_C family protein [Clostridiales bacterium]|nr:C_GCAxxG_C_C family protein [Clostridiales bacterium]
MGSRKDLVIKNHYSGCNCSQSVFSAYFDLFDGIQDRETALKLSLAFGGGLARMQEGICGAVCGGIMLLGLKHAPVHNPTGDQIWDFHYLIRDFLEDFKEKNGSIYCKDIIRCDITTPEAYEKAYDNLENYCVKAVLNAVDLLENKYKILEK